MNYVLPILALGLLVALHELGHLLGARLLRVRVRRFSFGFGPPVLSVERGGTRFTVGAVPLGGSVDIQGMNPHEDPPEGPGPHSLAARPPWHRLLVHLAGPLLNYGVAILVLSGLYLSGTHVPVPMTVGTVEPGSEAARAGLRPGDRVLQVDGLPVEEWSTLVEQVAARADRPLRLTLLRYGEAVEVQLTPRPDEDGAGRIGVSQQYVYREHEAGEAVGLAFSHAHRVVGEGLALVPRLLRGGREVAVSAPVGAFKQASHAARSGLDAFLRVFATLSLALACLHLIPVPALDGGRILFALIAWVTGRRVPTRVETLLHAAGFVVGVAILLALGAGELRRMLAHHAPPPPAPAPAAAPAPPPLPPPAVAAPVSGDAGAGTPPAPVVSDLPP